MRRRRPARLAPSAMSLAVRLMPAWDSSSSASRAAPSASSPAAVARSRRRRQGAPESSSARVAARQASTSARSSRPTGESSRRARSRSPAARRAAAAISSGVAPAASGAARQLRFQHLGRERREVDRLAARGDRLQQALGLGAEQDQVDEGRRLLQRLQQRVLALVAHRLGGVDDEDAVLAFEGPVGGGADHPLAHLVDHVLGAARGEPDEVGVRRGVEQGAAAGVVGIGAPRRRRSPPRRPAPRPASRTRAGRGRGRRATAPPPAPR